MHDRAQFWSAVPDWPRVSLRAAGIDIAPVNAASVWLVSGDAQQLLARYGAGETLGPRQVCNDDCYALRVAPDRVVFVADAQARDASAAVAPGCAITDVSDGMLIFEVRGEAAAELMAQGSEYPFDDETVFPLESASMQFAGFRLIVSRRAQGWRLHIERPWAPALWRWLQAHVGAT
jgi:heterotetrameric sarcosine oxidase gamma subunit